LYKASSAQWAAGSKQERTGVMEHWSNGKIKDVEFYSMAALFSTPTLNGQWGGNFPIDEVKVA